ncbi:uncharacterized protein An03g04050 [Aspergillus niger]|uniref:Contig An03c0120, genomic contig n=2 Tax=Aspergillus niger TaxID=5061 RepID=A2QGP7_ASPNC|nr:uncharacterized protein An03g04050 [Aspergillus niger]CAK47844.1 unnamed protein product [Aspergillus niger]
MRGSQTGGENDRTQRVVVAALNWRFDDVPAGLPQCLGNMRFDTNNAMVAEDKGGIEDYHRLGLVLIFCRVRVPICMYSTEYRWARYFIPGMNSPMSARPFEARGEALCRAACWTWSSGRGIAGLSSWRDPQDDHFERRAWGLNGRIGW